MKIQTKQLIGFILIITIANCCLGQNSLYKNKVRPVVQAKIDSMYPKAVITYIYESDSLQKMQINCHCDETVGMIILVFDTNGNFQSKEVHYYGSLNGLPDTILNYIKKNESTTIKFDKKNTMKYYNNKGEVSYGIDMWEFTPWSRTDYILKFKSTGEFISKELIPPERFDN